MKQDVCFRELMGIVMANRKLSRTERPGVFFRSAFGSASNDARYQGALSPYRLPEHARDFIGALGFIDALGIMATQEILSDQTKT